MAWTTSCLTCLDLLCTFSCSESMPQSYWSYRVHIYINPACISNCICDRRGRAIHRNLSNCFHSKWMRRLKGFYEHRFNLRHFVCPEIMVIDQVFFQRLTVFIVPHFFTDGIP